MPEDGQADITPDEARSMWASFRASCCDHCGGVHARACPRVRRISWHDNGRIGVVEFWADGSWPDDHVQWPETMPPDPDS